MPKSDILFKYNLLLSPLDTGESMDPEMPYSVLFGSIGYVQIWTHILLMIITIPDMLIDSVCTAKLFFKQSSFY